MISTDRYAVFGHPIKHSKSPRIHQAFARQTGQALEYTAKEVTPGYFETEAKAFFDSGGKGLNCTVPLKELAWRYAEQNTARAQAAKAVNTLIRQPDGAILGDNTDGIGLVTDLTVNHSIKLTDSRILILGAGGASRGIIGPLIDRQPQTIVIANRTVSKAVSLAHEFAGRVSLTGCGFDDLIDLSFDLILNATSMSLTNDLPPLPDSLLAKHGVCYDLAYANVPTAFVRWGRQQHARKSVDGLGMLVEQAAEAFYIWRGVRPETRPVIQLLNSERTF